MFHISLQHCNRSLGFKTILKTMDTFLEFQSQDHTGGEAFNPRRKPQRGGRAHDVAQNQGTGSPAILGVGDTVTYTVTITNLGLSHSFA